MSPRKAREKRKLTLQEAAAGIGGIDPANLSRIERGIQDASPDTARAIVAYYEGDVNFNDLYARREAA